ncbi:MAG: alpha/beta hydrolase family protein [Rhodospirillaceae bacterium]
MTTRNEPIELEVDGERIAGTRISPESRLPGVLFVHGWGGSQDQYLARAREVAALGCICVTFDLRGHAGTERQRETVTREQNLRDVLQAYDALVRSPGVDRDAIAVVGSSYGGYLAAIATGLRKIRWLALRAPALYKDDDWDMPKRKLHEQQNLVKYRRQVVSPTHNRALKACSVYSGDVLLIESEHDTVIPHPVIASYIKACGQARSLTHRVISGADHALSEEAFRKSYSSLLVNWLNEMITGARGDADAPQGAAQRDTMLHTAAAG